MNIVKIYLKVKNKPIKSKAELARFLKVNQSFIYKLNNGQSVLPKNKKLDFYILAYESLPVAAQRYVMKDVTNMLSDMTSEVDRARAALKGFEQ